MEWKNAFGKLELTGLPIAAQGKPAFAPSLYDLGQ